MQSLIWLLFAILSLEGESISDLRRFLQVDNVDSGRYDDPRCLPPNSCTRPCDGRESRICYYKFTLEPFSANGKACRNCSTNVKDCYKKGCITADGFERSLLSINRRMPAPSIQVCFGDLLIIDVINKMPGRSTTIHWHGMLMKDTKFMDGVPMVTQCPILESTTFRYSFVADHSGLHFYHSHDGYQKADGLVGGMMIRVPRCDDPHSARYDCDLPSHVIVVQDWHNLTADSMAPGLLYDATDQLPKSYLIQGRGQRFNEAGVKVTNTPLAEFCVMHGKRYVFRIIAGTCFACLYLLTIEDHSMLIIGADTQPTKPYRVKSLTMSAGERYSVVVYCNQPIRSYWIQVRVVGACSFTRAYQLAILRYRGAPRTPPSPAPTYNTTNVNCPGLVMSPVNSDCSENSRVTKGPCVADLRGAALTPPCILKPQPDVRLFWALGFNPFTEDELFCTCNYKLFMQSPAPPFPVVSATINGITFMQSPSPLLSQPEDIPWEHVCPRQGFDFRTWNKVHRECINIMKVPKNAVVEIVTVDTMTRSPVGISHPIHLHGYDMYVMEMGILKEGVPFNESFPQLRRCLNSNKQPRIPLDMVMKDAIPLSSGGYIVSRIFTDNPGFWVFHCHFLYHQDSGMRAVLQVGEIEDLPLPPRGFPRCGNFDTIL